MICCNEGPNVFAFKEEDPIVEVDLKTSVSIPATFNMFFSHPAAIDGNRWFN